MQSRMMDDHGRVHAPPSLRRLQYTDVEGIALLILAALVSSALANCSHAARTSIYRAIGFTLVAIIRFYALSHVPLSLAVVTVATATVSIDAIHSTIELPTHRRRNGAGVLVATSGVLFLASFASTSDQHVTAAMIRDRFTRVSVLQHLLVCLASMVCLLAWINETHYAFVSSGSGSWPRSLGRLLFDKMRRRERVSVIRARSYAVLSATAGGCAVLGEKCVSEIFRTEDSGLLMLGSPLALVALLTVVWFLMAMLECYWWRMALGIDLSKRLLLLRYYFAVWTVVGVVHGILFFDEMDSQRTAMAAIGLLMVYGGLGSLVIESPRDPKCDDSQGDDRMPLLLDASESLLYTNESAIVINNHTRITQGSTEEEEATKDLEEPPSSYRPPAHFRRI